MNLDHDLRRAFRRTPAPDDLAGRVLARIAKEDLSGVDAKGRLEPAPTYEDASEHAGTSARRPMIRWLAAAAAVTLMAAGGARYYAYQQTVAEAERVQADIRLALQITGEKIALVQRKVEDSQR